MNNLKLLLLLVFPAMLSMTPANTRVKFTDKNWDAAKEDAKKEGKLYFVDFDASYCAVCRNMDESTYQDQLLAEYMQDNVIANRIDVQDFDGVMWSQQYEVEALPTMLIFNSQGKLLKRLEGFQSGKKLLEAFRSLDVPENRKKSGGSSSAPTSVAPTKPATIPSTTKPSAGTYKPVLTTDKPTTPPAPPRPAPTQPVVVVPTPTKPPVAGLSTGGTIYEFRAKKLQPKGFCVQIGSFGDYEKVLVECDKLANNTSEKIMVQTDKSKNTFKILAGVFATKKEADTFRKSLINKGYDGIVKEF